MGRAIRSFARALRGRCPNCGGGPVTVRWVTVLPTCPRCGLRLDRGEPDYFLGAIVFNMAFAEGLFAVGMVGALLWSWPDPPWNALMVGGAVAMILGPIVLYPISKLCWLAFDLLFRPPREEDFTKPGAGDQPPPAPDR